MSGFIVSQPKSSRTPVTLRVELDGNFFRRDPGKTLRANVRDMLAALADDMQDEVRRQISSHASEMPFYSGWSYGNTIGHVTSNKTGRRWQTWAAVQAQTAGMDAKDAKRTKAAAAGIEQRWHPYRSVKSGIYRSRALITADLAAGLE